MNKLLHYVALFCLLSLVGWGTLEAQETGPVVEGGVLISWSGASGQVTIPDDVTEIAPNVFLKNNKVTALHLNKVHKVGKNACREMRSVVDFSAPEVEILEDSALYRLGSWQARQFHEADFPQLKKIGTAALAWALTPKFYTLPQVEEIGKEAFNKSAPWSVDLSEAVNLRTIAPDAFPFASPWGKEQCYIFVANEAVLAKMPATFPDRIFTRVVQIDRSTPIASVKITLRQGANLGRALPWVGSYTEGKVVGMDLGDGKIRLFALASPIRNSQEPTYYVNEMMQWLKSAVADPEIKVYGTDFDCFCTPWAAMTQLDLSRATQLKKLDLSYVSQSLFPDLASYSQLERLSLYGISGLEQLDLSHNPLKRLEIRSCDTLQAVVLPPSGLETLTISDCRNLTHIDEAPLASVQQLELTANALSGTLDLSGAKQLKEADLSGNKLTELTINNPLLTDLRCSRNQLKEIHTPTTSEALQGVRSVAIAGNRIQEGELNRFYTALPDLKQEATAGKLILLAKIATTEEDNNAYASDLELVRDKNWKFYDLNGQEMTGMIIKADTLVSWNNATGDIELPASVRVIGEKAFINNPTVTSIKGVNVEECYGITGCDKLKKVTFPKLKRTLKDMPTSPSGYKDANELGTISSAPFCTELYGTPTRSFMIRFMGSPLLEPVVGADGVLFFYPKSKAVGKVTLDPSIKTISYAAFDGCKQMTELEATGVTAIYARAFQDCSELAKVTLPALQHTQGNPFWEDCPKLQEVKTAQGIWLDRKATGTVVIPDGVEFIAVNAYRDQTAITALQFPGSLRRIGQYAFSKTGITSMPSLEGVTEIHTGAFFHCASLAGVLNVPSSVTILSNGAFAQCSSLTSAFVGATISSVPSRLFDGCDALSEVSMGSTIVTCNLIWTNSKHLEPTAPQKLILHAPVKAQYRICTWANMPPSGFGDPRKTLDVYVPAPLLEEYKNEKNDPDRDYYDHFHDNYTYHPIESSATEATVTINQVAGCTIVVKNGAQNVPSGSSLPIGTKLTIYAHLESGKLLQKFLFNGADLGSINRYDLTLTEPMTFSAEVTDFTPEASEWDLIGSFSTEQTHAGDPLYFYFSNGNDTPISFAVDCGGGRYLCQTRKGGSRFRGITAAEENPVVKVYEKKRPAHDPIRVIDVLQNVAAIEWGYVENITHFRIGYINARNDASLPWSTQHHSTLSELDLSKMTKLAYLGISRNAISTLDLTSNTELIDLVLKDLKIARQEDLKLPETLPTIYIEYLPWKSFDPTAWQQIKSLRLANMTSIEQLDLSRNPNIEELSLYDAFNQLRSLVASPKLAILNCPTARIPRMGACAWDDFYRSLPTDLNVEGKKLLLTYLKSENPEQDEHFAIRSYHVVHSTTSIAAAKGYAIRAYTGHFTSTDFEGSGDGCRDSYAIGATCDNAKMQIVYRENGVEKPLPGTVARGAKVEIEYVYPVRFDAALTINGQNSASYHVNLRISAADGQWHYIYSFDAVRDMLLDLHVIVPTAAVTLRTVGEGTLGLVGTSEREFELGTELTVEAQPADGWSLAQIKANGVDITQAKSFTLTSATEVVATFTKVPEYVVRFTSAGHGHLTATKNGQPFTSGSRARKDDKLVITAHPDAGYNVDKWLVGTEEIELPFYTGRTTFEATVGEEEVVVKTTFVIKTFAVTVAESAHGKLSVAGYDNLSAVPYGTRLTVTATPDAHYTLHKITVNGTDITGAKSFEVTEETTIQGEFVKETFAVTVAESTHGKLSVAGYDNLSAVPYGTRLTVTATPDKGYILHKITANGTDITSAKSFEVTEATTIRAEFKEDTALEAVATDPLILYPNPTKDVVFLSGGAAYAPVAIYSLEGVCLLSTETDAEGKARINIATLSEGSYLVKVGTKSLSLIVVH